MTLIDLLASLMLVIAVQVHAAHVESWTDRYTDETGVRCCQRECEPADVAMASVARSEVWVNGELLTLPVGAIHPMPDDAPLAVSGFVCWKAKWAWPKPESVRCVWFRPGIW
jgi:hypothetical protein